MDNPFFNKYLRGTTPVLIRISHDDLAEPLYLTDNNEELEFEGNVYKPFHFVFSLPETTSESMGNAKLKISVIDQRLIRIMRTLHTAPTLVFMATYQEDKANFTVLERASLTFGDITWNVSSMEAELVLDTLLLLEFPSGKFSPVATQGIA